MIKWFEDIDQEDFYLVGGKAANLAKMYKHGLKVPKGFVVLSTAYDAYIEDNELASKITSILDGENLLDDGNSLDHGNSQDNGISLDEKAARIQALFTVDKLPKNLIQELFNGFAQISGGRVAVRSSSTAEDLPGMSFAGQYSSFLNVEKDELLDKIIQCWQSLWNVRAMDYRSKLGIDSGFSHGVIIQEMINSHSSGVVFTANPMNGLRQQMVVNVSWGLGEAIVSGHVNPDQYIIDRQSHHIIDQVINKKEVQYIYGDRGLKQVNVSREDQLKVSISKDQLDQLSSLCDKVEDYFGLPQDMEFAFDHQGELYLLQSRDITTLYPIDDLRQDEKLRPYLSASTVMLGIREPFTPLGYDLMSFMFPTIINVMTSRKKKPLSNSFVAYAGGRIFIDMSYLMANGFIAKQFASGFSANDIPLKTVMLQVIKDYGKTLKRQGIHFRLPLGIFKYGAVMTKDILKISRIPHDQRYEALKEEGNRWYRAILKDYEKADTTQERLDFATKALVEAFKLSQKQSSYCLDVNNYIKIEKVLKKHFGSRYKVEILAQSLDGCVTQTLTMDLNKYAKFCSEQNKEPSLDDPEFIEILKTNGHRATVELDFGTKRWSEDPSYLLKLVKSYMVDKMYERNLLDHANKRQQALDMIEEVTRELVPKIGKRRAKKFQTYMMNYRYGLAMREYPKWDIVRFLQLSRKSVQVIGKRLVDQGKLEEMNHIFFLRKDEILAGKDLKTLVKQAKASYAKEMNRKSIPRMLLNNGRTYYSATIIKPGTKTIQGAALSAGTYEGVIKVVYDPLNNTLKEGEIMVTESTNPAWTPLFATAGGLIMEYGGPMSHGGIVAREYGIPAVVGIPSATEVLKDGQKVRINGETGLIELL